jgi:hypothetical protein
MVDATASASAHVGTLGLEFRRFHARGEFVVNLADGHGWASLIISQSKDKPIAGNNGTTTLLVAGRVRRRIATVLGDSSNTGSAPLVGRAFLPIGIPGVRGDDAAIDDRGLAVAALDHLAL